MTMTGNSIDIPLQLVLFSIPSLIYFSVQKRKYPRIQIQKELGLTSISITKLFYALTSSVFFSLAAIFLFKYSGFNLQEIKHTSFEKFMGGGGAISIVLVIKIILYQVFFIVSGEEIFFRGFVAGILFRKYRFWVGNVLQAIIFLLPHMMLLILSPKFCILLLFLFFTSLVVGFFRFKTESIIPGIIMHTLGNTAVILYLIHTSAVL